MGEYGGVVIDNPEDLREYIAARGSGRFRVAYRDNGRSGVPLSDVFVMLHDVHDVTICIEEASKYLGPTGADPEVEWFFQYGRHNRQSIIAVARRPQELSRMATSQADVVVSFQQKEPRDMQYLRDLAGSEVAERIRNLDRDAYEFDYVIAEHDEIVATINALSEGDDNGLVDGRMGDSGSPGENDSVGGGVADVVEVGQGSVGAGETDDGTRNHDQSGRRSGVDSSDLHRTDTDTDAGRSAEGNGSGGTDDRVGHDASSTGRRGAGARGSGSQFQGGGSSRGRSSKPAASGGRSGRHLKRGADGRFRKR